MISFLCPPNFKEAAASAGYICPTLRFSFLANAGGEGKGTEEQKSQVLLGRVRISYGGALWSKVIVRLYWSNREQNPAPNLSIDLDREFQNREKLYRSIPFEINGCYVPTCIPLRQPRIATLFPNLDFNFCIILDGSSLESDYVTYFNEQTKFAIKLHF